MAKKYTDHLCRSYADAIVFFDSNIEVLEENIRRKNMEGGDTKELTRAKERVQHAREGVTRMLSDRVQSMQAGVVAPDVVLERLGMIKQDVEGEWAKTIDMAIALIVKQRERLTNTDRGRRSLQKLLGTERRKAKNMYMACEMLEAKNIELRKAMAPLISEREKMLQLHAAHHCAQQECMGCPFEGYCHAQNVDKEYLPQRRADMAEKLKDM